MLTTDPNVTNTLPHAYDHQCRCSSCTAQEITWQKMSVTMNNDDKKSRVLQGMIAERMSVEEEVVAAHEEWLARPNAGSWDAYQNAENRLRAARAKKI